MKTPAPLSSARISQIGSDNAAARSALATRSEALDGMMQAVDNRLTSDAGLAAYPGAQQQLKAMRASAEKAQVVIGQEQAVRDRLATATAAGDQSGIRKAQQDLVSLKKKNRKIYGIHSTASPVMECPAEVTTAKCDTAIKNVSYAGSKGPSSPLSPKNPCYGTSLAQWDGWDAMIAHGCATAEERDMITAMSTNEGSFEAVQSYDSQALTLGAMQKTVNATGGGELTDQLQAFKAHDEETYTSLFADHGWTVEKGKTYFTDASGTKRTGTELKDYLRSAGAGDQVKALAPLRSAGRDPAFRKQQICDFIDRAHVATDRPITSGKKHYPAGDFITSTQGKAMLMDSSVNGGPAEKSFQKAVDWYYKANPTAGRDPSAWTAADRATNEQGILARYAATRKVASPSAETREKRNGALSKLSPTSNPGGLASKRPARDCPDCP